MQSEDSEVFMGGARISDPGTSQESAKLITSFLPELESKVLDELRVAGADGRTLDELVDALRIEKVTVSPRLSPLCRKHLARDSSKKRPGKSGRKQIVWEAIAA